jgi:mono/diheme cytochrome c family protein
MSRRARVWPLILTLLTIACLLPETRSASQQPAGTQGEPEAGKLFEKDCAKCHGKDGRAKTFRGKLVGAKNLTDAAWQAKVTDEQIAAAIKQGPGSMPEFEKKLSQAEIDSLVTYVRKLKAEPAEKK